MATTLGFFERFCFLAFFLFFSFPFAFFHFLRVSIALLLSYRVEFSDCYAGVRCFQVWVNITQFFTFPPRVYVNKWVFCSRNSLPKPALDLYFPPSI